MPLFLGADGVGDGGGGEGGGEEEDARVVAERGAEGKLGEDGDDGPMRR